MKTLNRKRIFDNLLNSYNLTIMIFLFQLLISIQTKCQVIHVPADQPSIQAAIDAAAQGDTVLVSEGEYFENISFRNKNLIVCSEYATNGGIEHIYNTIINGSYPINQDTASCVIIAGGQDSTTVLQGFTLTGGLGTLWEDEHGPGYFYTEGGGILIQYSAPTIKNNIITSNMAINVPAGATSAGGGAIRCGDGNPKILNNLITNNEGKYGAGLVLNYSGAVIKNNIFAYNTGGENYGGGGLWCLSNGAEPVIIENNTVVYNHSALGGGGIRLWSCIAELKNNIFWGNTATTNPQIQGNTGIVTYNCIEGGWTGEGNIGIEPEFTGNNFLLNITSPCIDSGDPNIIYNDPEDPDNPGNALFPAQGGLTNDMGATGGQMSMEIPDILTNTNQGLQPYAARITVFPNPITQDSFTIRAYSEMSGNIIDIIIADVSGRTVINNKLMLSGNHVSQNISGLQHGIYLLKVELEGLPVYSQKIVVVR